MPNIRITGLAEISGLTPPTIRFYEHTGLLPAASRTSSGHRVYNDRDVDRLRFIVRAKHMGFSLDEIRELIHSCGDNPTAVDLDRALDTLRTRIAEVNERVAELSAFSAQLLTNLWAIRTQRLIDTASAEQVCREHWAQVLSLPHTRQDSDDLITLTFPSSPALVVSLTGLVAHESVCQPQAAILLRCNMTTTVLELGEAEVTRHLIDDLFSLIAEDLAVNERSSAEDGSDSQVASGTGVQV
ncbi:MerR family transcriptional regulator [Lentzea cavernae]|uniref:MerR family transcriptional regulator n=1 Tax=Lentzea cavernae TaxID=2020703 RepID=A0ABQ3MG52_9PSEU|nr:MerR family transcriptional regulator [Lentzea cavernae]GHH43584.1 MerR family transcriptional regulator [Lentzea cavernae]